MVSLQDIINTILLIFIIVIVSLIIIAWIIMLYGANKLDEAYKVGKAKETVCGEFYLEGESARSNIYDAYVGKDNETGIEDLLQIVFKFFYYSIYLLIILLTFYHFYIFLQFSYAEQKKIKLLSGFIIIALIIILILWNVYYFKKRNDSINPFDDTIYKISGILSNEGKNNLVVRQVAFIVSIFIILLIIYYTNITSVDEASKNIFLDKSSLKLIGVCFVLLGIFLPYISNEVYTLNDNIKSYYNTNAVSGSDSVNQLLYNVITDDAILNDNLRKNIKDLDNLQELPSALVANNTNIYANKLYRYVLNGVNMAEIRNITISDELASIIEPFYLKGEYIILLKNDFLIFYNSPVNQRSRNFETYVKKYLRSEYRSVATFGNCTGSQANITKCNLVKTLVTRYILNNDTYKISNIVPVNVRAKLQDLRKDTRMEDTANTFYKRINSMSIVLFCISTYILFHKLYEQNSDYVRQWVTSIMIFVLLIIGFAGWFFKDLWL